MRIIVEDFIRSRKLLCYKTQNTILTTLKLIQQLKLSGLYYCIYQARLYSIYSLFMLALKPEIAACNDLTTT